ncbi:MAG: prepilin-type N-terminal cleavage/methylation domain-containing protein [Synergistaceae bacterium]|jgi:prepilin-type N-terminal cleavage/methylation domain-containing protein|nr:prepilin-type N-terminal cleavage/methylation domain-containing protein [Synergistaceae bacterium]
MAEYGGRRKGFTLLEIVVVAAIAALIATLALPRGFFSADSTFQALNRAVLELSDIALDGYSIRLRMEIAEEADRGRIVAEVLAAAEGARDPARPALEWKPLQTRYPLEGEEWRLEPEIVYFYSDGTCTPARILRAERDVRVENGEAALLTVTGFLFEPETP